MASYDWIMGLGLILGLPLLFMYLTHAGVKSYFVYATMIDIFCVYGGLLEVWTLVVLIIIDVIIVYMDRRSGGVG